MSIKRDDEAEIIDLLCGSMTPEPRWRRWCPWLPVTYYLPRIRLFVLSFSVNAPMSTVPLFKTHVFDLHKATDGRWWPWIGFQVWL